mgnify:CR=1 FL=1
MQQKQVVTAFLRNCGRILLVRRSSEVGTYRGRWSGISGYLEDTPFEQALTEIREETGLGADEVELVNQAEPLQVCDVENDTEWQIYPFLFDTEFPERVRLDWENLEMVWIQPAQIVDYPTVPALKKTLESVWPQAVE